jgi:hypothetical protein
MTRPIRLHPTGQTQQFRDDAGRLWERYDADNPPADLHERPWFTAHAAPFCGTCGGRLAGVTYYRRQGTVIACEPCVEIAQ